MSVIAFDTLKYAKRLKDSGVPDKQAEAEAEALAEVLEVNLKDLATKEDLRRDLRELEQRMIIKLGGMMMAAIAIVATLVKLL
ncbi:MAG: DUF1640 domain-containing protein [Candidatus Methylumidiphilus alinenensis]|uniref:DUF1640 domain-containing protein n=1 Tax=Candidatus Methylumidiphilus alinenensis TaxID=2202197 RepID=A0A2W4T297_9GAMM|nr:MAG: DUF1640 domain-containing protein [Candidatus Methylumidiphilus alinenensis]